MGWPTGQHSSSSVRSKQQAHHPNKPQSWSKRRTVYPSLPSSAISISTKLKPCLLPAVAKIAAQQKTNWLSACMMGQPCFCCASVRAVTLSMSEHFQGGHTLIPVFLSFIDIHENPTNPHNRVLVQPSQMIHPDHQKPKECQKMLILLQGYTQVHTSALHGHNPFYPALLKSSTATALRWVGSSS